MNSQHTGQLNSNWWLRHDTGSPQLAAEHLLCAVSWSGTPCLMTSAHSRTMFLLNRAWKPGFSLGTSVHSALETFVTMRYINPHLPYHYHTIPMIVLKQNCLLPPQRLDLFAWHVRPSRLPVSFRTHFKSLHFHFVWSFHFIQTQSSHSWQPKGHNDVLSQCRHKLFKVSYVNQCLFHYV